MSSPSKQPLSRRFAVWYPAYRKYVVAVAIVAAFGGALLNLENNALEALTGALRPSAGAGVIAMCLQLLGAFIALRLTRLVLTYFQSRVQAALDLRSRDELEVEILAHLLGKDDAFFSRRSPAEILNRLSGDIARANTRRGVFLQIVTSVFLLAGAILLFVQKSWPLAIAGVATVGLGAALTHRISRPLQEMDRTFMQQDDRVKGRFEDFLQAAPEIQVGNLFSDVRRWFQRAQQERSHVWKRFQILNAVMGIAQGGSYVLAIASLLVLIVLVFAGHDVGGAVRLVPVVLYVLPTLFGHASTLVLQRVALDRARTSEERLLEYEGTEPADTTTSRVTIEQGLPIKNEGATFRYTGPSGALQGGVVDVTTEIPARRWTAIVGPSGSGKSTMLQLLLGRATPQSGRVLYGELPIAELHAEDRAAILTLMPQRPVLLDATVEENLLFGRASDQRTVGPADLALLERVGLGELLCARAFDMEATPEALASLGPRVAGLRTAARSKLRAAGIEVAPYEDSSSVDPGHWLMESMLRARVDRAATATSLSEVRRVAAFATTDVGRRLAAIGGRLLDGQQKLLALPGYEAFAKLAPVHVVEGVWELRRAALKASRRAAAARRAVALSAATAEMTGERDEAVELIRRVRDDAASVAALTQIAGDEREPFDVERAHGRLTWRENMVFGVVDARNQRAAQEADRALTALVTDEGLLRDFVRIGLGFAVGRGGARLSGGQRQLVALCRALGRGTPVVVLDEPTSALDPSSRARVATVLREWRDTHLVVTVTHDADLVRESDEVRMLESGRLAASGSFEALARDSEAFRRVMRVT